MKMFNIPNLFTAANMLCGVLAIILALAGRIDIAPFLIFLGAILDFFDGFLARLLKQQGELGKQLDSLADMITFGLAPGIIMFVIMLNFTEYGTNHSGNVLFGLFHGLAEYNFNNLFPFSALIIPFFSMFRLAKFNIDTRQSESFIGLPTPANTIFFMAFPLLLVQYGDTIGWEHDLIMWIIQPMILIPIIVVMSVLLVSELPLFALKFKHFKWQGNEIRYIFLISCGLLIAFLWTWSIAIIVLLYLLLSFIQHILRKKSNV
ncbi:MAG: CDP-alcohol phosphatidyltransferase family protein [Fluviicola sp.]|nr:CDP-alcohol phosphatidyltransferase family protein [Fluviicola sp.]